MIRKIIEITEEKCNGCGICAKACHEGAIAMVNGKATLIRDDYCDGLGDCLPACPTGAIAFVEREAAAYDQAAVDAHLKPSKLRQWPVQLKLVPVKTPYFQNADLLVAADCAAFTHGTFHQTFLDDHALVIGCPKLDSVDYTDKLTQILASNTIQSVTIVRMEVPCCGGIQRATQIALEHSGKDIPCQVITLSTTGEVL